MSRQSVNDAVYWYEKAEEVRILAGLMREPEPAAMMLRLADSYDTLARAAEKRQQKVH